MSIGLNDVLSFLVYGYRQYILRGYIDFTVVCNESESYAYAG
jgi:hypothetical protein